MKFEDLEKVRAASSDCPSDLLLDGLANGDLGREEAQRVEAHCSNCDGCNDRLKTFRRGFATVPEYDEHAALRRLVEANERRHAASRFSWLNLKGLLVAAPALAAAGALVLMLSKPGEDAPTAEPGDLRDTTRLKGNLRLAVVRKTASGSEELVSGEPVAPDATLRFVVTLPRGGRVTVVGVETSGTLYTAWPLPEHAADPVLPQCEKELLPGAIQLDGKPGQEMLHLVLCDRDVEPSCVSRGASDAPQCAEGCVSTRFSINKQPP